MAIRIRWTSRSWRVLRRILLNVVVIDPDDQPADTGRWDFIVAPPLYGIWIYDPRDDTQLPIVAGEEGFMFTEVVSADPRPIPPVVPTD